MEEDQQLPDRLRVPRQIDAQGASAMLLDGLCQLFVTGQADQPRRAPCR